MVAFDGLEVSDQPSAAHRGNRISQELVFRKNEPKEVRAKTTSREGADEDVGVEEHPHDTSRNTSSSLR